MRLETEKDLKEEKEIFNEVCEILKEKGHDIYYEWKPKNDQYCHWEAIMYVDSKPYIVDLTRRFSYFSDFDDEFVGKVKYDYLIPLYEITKNFTESKQIHPVLIVKYFDRLVSFDLTKITQTRIENRINNGTILRFKKENYKILKEYDYKE